MKKFFLCLLCCAVIPLCGSSKNSDETQRREKKLLLTMADFPEVIVSFNKHKFTKNQVVKWVMQSHPDFEDYSYPELLDAIDRVIDEKLYYTLLADFLKKEGFAPSHEMTLKYLQDSIKKFPAELRKIKYKNSKIQTLAAETDRRISVALQNYLKKKKPDIISVNDDEVEYFYRLNQPIFMYDAKIDISFIAVDKKSPDAEKIIKNAHSMLMQGVKFEKLAKEINSKLPENFFSIDSIPPEIAAQSAKIPTDEPSEIIEFPLYFAILKISRKQPPKYIPLKDAAFFIRTELESRKSGIYLEKLLYQLLAETKIKYHRPQKNQTR